MNKIKNKKQKEIARQLPSRVLSAVASPSSPSHAGRYKYARPAFVPVPLFSRGLAIPRRGTHGHERKVGRKKTTAASGGRSPCSSLLAWPRHGGGFQQVDPGGRAPAAAPPPRPVRRHPVPRRHAGGVVHRHLPAPGQRLSHRVRWPTPLPSSPVRPLIRDD